MPKRDASTAAAFLPKTRTIPTLREAAGRCRGCDLWQTATQTVFGEGGAKPRIMLVGEQPGDHEDRQGQPFVGPAGRLLDRALAEAGIGREQVYVTNAVKHFKWEPRGKRRLHKKPNALEIRACMPWLEAEIEVIRPQVIVCLGATAAQSLLGRQFKVTLERGRLQASRQAPFVLATVHPSSLLRVPDAETRRREIRQFIEDLSRAKEILDEQRLTA